MIRLTKWEVLTAWLLFAPLVAAAGNSPVIGCWRCESEGETSIMEFRNDHTALFDGEPAQYTLTEGAIQIQTEIGPVDYPYEMEGDKLVLIFPGDFRVPCSKIKCGKGLGAVPGGLEEGNEEIETPLSPGIQGTGNEHLLRGMFCHWSGSSSSYSGGSYSHSLRVNFDGQGHFTTGSESSFDNPSGQGYGSGEGGGGTYRVVGNEVHLQFNDGSTGVATVFNRAGDGSITELKYDGNLYAPQLCE